jgi:hypothetical protein
MATPPPPGPNTVLITHGGNISRLAGAESELGGFYLYRPDGRGGVEKVAISARWLSNRIRAEAPTTDRYIFTPADLVALAGGEAAPRPRTLPASGSAVPGAGRAPASTKARRSAGLRRVGESG